VAVFEVGAPRPKEGRHAVMTRGEISICASPSVEIVARSAPNDLSELAAQARGRPAVFIMSGMGGLTGSYVSPLLAYMARRSCPLVVAVVCTPFSVEGQGRAQHSQEGLRRLRNHADITLAFENDILAREVPNLPLSRAFLLMDELMNAIPNDACQAPLRKWGDEARSIAASCRAHAAALGLGAGSEATERAVRDALRSPWIEGGARSYKRGLMVVSGPPGADKIAMGAAADEAPGLELTTLLRPGPQGECRASILLGR
jgi:cell division GTPase FtsZ